MKKFGEGQQPFHAIIDIPEGDSQELTTVTDQALNSIYGELFNLLQAHGINPTATTNADLKQITRAVWSAVNVGNLFIDTGTANVKNLRHVKDNAFLYKNGNSGDDGFLIEFLNLVENTGAVTINVFDVERNENHFNNVALVDNNGMALTAKSLPALTTVKAFYDSKKNQFKILNIYNSNVNDSMVRNLDDFALRSVNVEQVASILDLDKIQKVDGRTIFVKSYHAGKGKGGGIFVFDESKKQINDKGLIINGWVRQNVTDIIPDFFGAYGDIAYDDTTAIQAAVNAAKKSICLVGEYKTTDSILIQNKHYFTIKGLGRDSIIYNTAAGKSGIKFINSESCGLYDFSIIGDGQGFYGTGATTGHGIEFQNSSLATLNNIAIRSQGGNGVFVTNGGWGFYFVNCKINFNKLDGVNALAATGGADGYYQNGNNLSLINVELNANGQNGIHWHALNLNISGCVIERNGLAGIFVDNTTYDVSSWGLTVTGNYFEANRNHCVLVNAASKALENFSITGNFFGDGSPFAVDGTYIKFIGDFGNVRNGAIYGNGMVNSTAYTFVDGGECLHETVNIKSFYKCSGIGKAKLQNGKKTLILNGATTTKSIPWSSMTGDSDNFFEQNKQKIIYFALPVDSESFIHGLRFGIKTNTTSKYTVNAYFSSLVDGVETDIAGTIKTLETGGDTDVDFLVTQQVPSGNGLLKVIISKLADGTSLKLTNPTLIYN